MSHAWPNRQICALLLVCLFVYDIFWVFLSPWFFGSNVMLRVAEQKVLLPRTLSGGTVVPYPLLLIPPFLPCRIWVAPK